MNKMSLRSRTKNSLSSTIKLIIFNLVTVSRVSFNCWMIHWVESIDVTFHWVRYRLRADCIVCRWFKSTCRVHRAPLTSQYVCAIVLSSIWYVDSKLSSTRSWDKEYIFYSEYLLDIYLYLRINRPVTIDPEFDSRL